MTAPIVCACGRSITARQFRPHARKCPAQLRAWRDDGREMYLLDERSADQKKRDPIVEQDALSCHPNAEAEARS